MKSAAVICLRPLKIQYFMVHGLEVLPGRIGRHCAGCGEDIAGYAPGLIQMGKGFRCDLLRFSDQQGAVGIDVVKNADAVPDLLF